MKVIMRLLCISIGLIIPMLGFAQDRQTTPKPIYVSKSGKIYIKSKTPLYLRLTNAPDGTGQDVILRSQSTPRGKQVLPFHFEGHGRHTIQHPADHRIPQKNKEDHIFYVYDDGKPPRIKVSVTKAPWVYNKNVNVYGKPVTITLKATDADSGVSGSFTALNSDLFTSYNQPIVLSQEQDYALKFYSVDNVGNKSRERLRLYSLDFTPPVSRHKVLGGHVVLGGEDIVSPKSKIQLLSEDPKAGVKSIRYRFKGIRATFKNKLLTMDGLKAGTHSVVYAATDKVNNAEKNKTFSFYLDKVPPSVSFSLLGDQYSRGKNMFVSGFTTVELTATDNKAGVRRIRYYFPNNIARTYTSPFGFPKKNGRFSFSYAASDMVLNASRKVEKTVIVDVSPPKVTPKFKGEHYFSRKTHYVRLSTRISLLTTDNLSGVKTKGYQIGPATDNDKPVNYSRPFTLPTEGEQIVAFHATDNVNNKNKQNKVTMFVDERPPEIFHHFSVNATVPADNVYPLRSLLYLAATDKQSGIRDIYYRINRGKEIKYKNPLSFSRRTKYTINIRAIDNVGNQSTSQVTFTIR